MPDSSNIKLTPKQKLFCEAYLRTLNGTQSAIEAGYSARSAGAMASENLKKPNIDKYISLRMEEQLNGKIASANEVLEFYTKVMRGEVKDSFGMDASLDTRVNANMQLGKRHGLDKKVIETILEVPSIHVHLTDEKTYGDEQK